MYHVSIRQQYARNKQSPETQTRLFHLRLLGVGFIFALACSSFFGSSEAAYLSVATCRGVQAHPPCACSEGGALESRAEIKRASKPDQITAAPA